MFNAETTRFTPLDFRLGAASQFRLLALMCSFSTAKVSDLLKNFLKGHLLSSVALSSDRFEEQASILVDKFHTAKATGISAGRSFRLIMLLIGQGRLESALRTDAVIFNIPGSSQFAYNTNFYPRHDNATFSGVSSLRWTSVPSENTDLRTLVEYHGKLRLLLFVQCPAL